MEEEGRSPQKYQFKKRKYSILFSEEEEELVFSYIFQMIGSHRKEYESFGLITF